MRENNIPLPAELEELTKRVLIVDDDEPMTKAIARVFKRDGWEVRLAHDGFEAGVELGSFKPTLMTLDLKMPYMNGQKVLEMTRNKFGLTDLKILVISAQSESELQAALDGGADAVLAKPFDNEELLCLVEQWFSSE
jgi:DNA-binding response OmpR family regulator